MKEISEITIFDLFADCVEQELPYFQIRENAFDLGMSWTEFEQLFRKAKTSGAIKVIPNTDGSFFSPNYKLEQ